MSWTLICLLTGLSLSHPTSAVGAGLKVRALAGAGAGAGARARARGGAEPSTPPVPPVSIPDNSTPVHLLISAFQDGQRCANTISRALQQAAHPERLSFNVIQAAGPGDVECLEEFKQVHLPGICQASPASCAPPSDVLSRVHFWKIAPEEGQGPVHQRGLLSERADLSGPGSMCLSTDSHMDFTKGWDRDLLEDWSAAGNEFAVLSAYPLATRDANIAGTSSYINLCGYFISSSGVPRGATGGTFFNLLGKHKPQLTMNWAAGQSFARCHAEKNVPVDKYLRWIFDGEEVDRAVRLWTHGYDLYNPGVNVVMHNYSHATQKFWTFKSPTKAADEIASHARLTKLLRGEATEEEFGQFGLGSQRRLEDYVTWSRTDLGGKWKDVLASKGIKPLLAHGTFVQPGSDSQFCAGLQRMPVRNAGELVDSIGH